MSQQPLVTEKERARKALKTQEAKYMRENRTYVRMAIAYYQRWPAAADEEGAAATAALEFAEPVQKKPKAVRKAEKKALKGEDSTPVVCHGVPGSGHPCELSVDERKRASATKHTDGALHATCRACKREYKKLYPPVPRGEKQQKKK